MPIFTESSIRLLTLVKSTFVTYSGDLGLDLDPQSLIEFKSDSEIGSEVGLYLPSKLIELEV